MPFIELTIRSVLDCANGDKIAINLNALQSIRSDGEHGAIIQIGDHFYTVAETYEEIYSQLCN